MNLRAIEPGDLSGLFDLRASTSQNAYSREDLRRIGITEESAAALLRTTNRGWLCESGATKTGFAIGDGKTGEICVVAVAPNFEGQGIGSLLLRSVEDWLFSLGWKELWLWTSSDPMKRAFSFYTHRGWTVSEQKGDVVYMRKRAPDRLADPARSPGDLPAGPNSRRP